MNISENVDYSTYSGVKHIELEEDERLEEKEVLKRIKSIQSEFKKYSESVEDLYRYVRKKELHDLIAGILTDRNTVENLSNLTKL